MSSRTTRKRNPAVQQEQQHEKPSTETKKPSPKKETLDKMMIKSEKDGLRYQTGFNNSFETSAIPNALPVGRNNPLIVPYNLYTEQLSGTAFTSPRNENRRTWLYRIQPGVAGSSHDFLPCRGGGSGTGTGTDAADSNNLYHNLPKYFGNVDWESEMELNPNPMRWKPMPLPPLSSSSGDNQTNKLNFINGMKLLMGSGSPLTKNGLAIYMYSINHDMMNRNRAQGEGRNNANDVLNETNKNDLHLYNSDGDFLIVPQLGALNVVTELGILNVLPKEICVIPRGIVFSVNILPEQEEDGGGTPKVARGYVLEVFKSHFTLPELGPIGSNGLANARDFQFPAASYVSTPDLYKKPCVIVNKFGNQLFHRTNPHSPFNVVAWHGNYAPFKYNLEHFCAMNSVTYDHPDPSIYTVLTCPGGGTGEMGTALADFVIFPPRIMATDSNTFRPPWYHRNTMSEFMGLIWGQYDAKRGFEPGGASLHSTMTPHGPDSDTYYKSIRGDCSQPTKFESGLAFMFETSCMMKLSRYALDCDHRDLSYAKCWDELTDNFSGWDVGQTNTSPVKMTATKTTTTTKTAAEEKKEENGKTKRTKRAKLSK